MATITRRLAAVAAAAAVSAGLVPAAAAPAQAAANWELRAMDVPRAQQASGGQGEGVTIAIVDTGVDDTHPALRGKVVQGPDFTGGSREQGDPAWGRHGTMMASDALKVAPKAKILSLRAIFDKGEPELRNWEEYVDRQRQGKDPEVTPLVKAIRYAVSHGADVISMSLGSGDDWFNFANPEEKQAITFAVANGVTVLASTGNEGEMEPGQRPSEANFISWPAGYLGVIAVAATQPGGTRAGFSSVHTYNDIATPGARIYSAQPGTLGHGYRFGQGTSQACALASGVVALMKSKNPELTPGEVRTILRRTASGDGTWNARLGFGQVNAAKAVAAAANPPKTLKEAVPYEGKEHLAEPDGTPKELLAPLHTVDIALFAIGCVLVVLFVGGGLLLARRTR